MVDAATTGLTRERCIPCEGGLAPLSRSEAEELRSATPMWSLDGSATHLGREITTKTFATALAIVERVAAVAEEQNHHPDIAFGWGYVRLSLQTHAIKGLHRNDFILAARIDAAIAAGQAKP